MFNKLIKWLIKQSKGNLVKKDIISWLILWLIFGFILWLIFGFISWLIFGFISWLIFGLIFGFISWLIFGLIFGLGSLLSVNLISFFKDLPTNYLFLIFLIFFTAEIVFWFFDNSKPNKKENKFKFTIKRKFIDFGISAFAIMQFLGLINTYKELSPQFKQYYPEILKWVGYLGVGIFILVMSLLVLFLFIKFNEQKYKE